MLFQNASNKENPFYYRVAEHTLNNDLSVIEVGYNRMPKGLKKNFLRNVYILHYITNGEGRFLGHKFNSQNAYLVAPNEYEVFEADEHTHYDTYWIMFKGAMAENILNMCGLRAHSHVFNFSETQKCGEILHRAVFNIQPHNALEEAALMQSCFYELLAVHLEHNAREPSKPHNIIERIKHFIDNNYYQPISLNELFENYNYTRNHIYNLFKQSYGTSPKEYLLNKRIAKAKQMLLDKKSSHTVAEIAYTVGFNDPLYFSRVFKKKTSLTPSQFKQSTRVK